jgi:N-acetyl-anhydromuramyl-L-alanine amidase AmpD
MDIGAEEIRKWHTDPKPHGNGWSDIGYNFIIRRDGTIEAGRDKDNDGDVMEEVGAHAKGFNHNSVGICLVGGKPRFNFTPEQLKSLDFLMNAIEADYCDIQWVGHYELNAGKNCPMFDVKALRGKS